MPILDKICLTSLVKCHSDLHCPTAAFGLMVPGLPSSVCMLGEGVKGKILESLAKCNLYFEPPKVHFEFNLTLVVNALALSIAPGAGGKSLEKSQTLPRHLPCLLRSFFLGFL